MKHHLQLFKELPKDNNNKLNITLPPGERKEGGWHTAGYVSCSNHVGFGNELQSKSMRSGKGVLKVLNYIFKSGPYNALPSLYRLTNSA